MARCCYHSSKLVYLLILHIVHVPLPWWDGDVIEHCYLIEASTEEAAQRRTVVTRYTWDIDVILLGVDPPDDLDDGPLSNRRHHPEGELYGASYVLRTASREPSLRTSQRLVPVLVHIARLAKALESLPVLEPNRWPHSFSATHPAAQSWRIALAVIRC